MTDAKRLHGEVFRTLKFAGATFLRVGSTWKMFTLAFAADHLIQTEACLLIKGEHIRFFHLKGPFCKVAPVSIVGNFCGQPKDCSSTSPTSRRV